MQGDAAMNYIARGHLHLFSLTSKGVINYRLTKWQNIFFTLAENDRQKICIYQKKAVPL